MHEIPPRLLFYPTSPVHVRDLRQVTAKLPEWRYQAILYEPLARVAPGIPAMLQNEGFEAITLEQNADPESQLPCNAALLVIGAVFEAFGVELCAWAKRRRIPVVAIQEVAQLALNQNDINNYDVPFDRLFVASRDEYQRFIALGYPSHLLRISGLLAYERLHLNQPGERDATLAKLGIADGKNPIVYTTSPLRGRLTLHNKDDLAFREAVLAQIASASRQTGRRAIIKLHPNEEIESTRDQILKIIPDAIVIGREFHIDELFGVAGVLVNRGNSQTCLEAVLRGIPTVVAACGLATLFHKDGGAYIVNDLHQVSDTIVRACAEGPVDISDVQARHFFLPTEGVGGFIAHELADLVANPPLAAHADWNWLIKSMLFIGRHDQALQFCK